VGSIILDVLGWDGVWKVSSSQLQANSADEISQENWDIQTAPLASFFAKVLGKKLLLFWKYRILQTLADTKLERGLGGNLNSLACRRVPALAGLSLCSNQLAKTR
jgi:hypothetical protein